MLENRGLEIVIIAVVVLLLFGAKRLPDSARALGKSLRILTSEVGAMKADDPPDATGQAAPPVTPTRTIRAAPGQAADARPAAQPEHRAAGTPQRAPGAG